MVAAEDVAAAEEIAAPEVEVARWWFDDEDDAMEV